MFLHVVCRIVVTAIVFALSAVARAQPHDAREVVDRARVYLMRYHDELATLIAEERYEQRLTPSGRNASWPLRRTLESEYLLLRGDDVPSGWLGFRDVLRVDGKPVADRAGRLESLLKSAGTNLRLRARAIADESARFNLGNVLRTINTPTMALEFLSLENAARVKTRKAAQKTANGLPVWVIAFEDTASPTIIRGPNGSDVRAHGELWIDPETGRVVQSELTVQQPIQTDITVTFARDDRLSLWVPSEMRETYRTREGLIAGVAQYRNYRRFETSGRIIGRRSRLPDNSRRGWPGRPSLLYFAR